MSPRTARKLALMFMVISMAFVAVFWLVNSDNRCSDWKMQVEEEAISRSNTDGHAEPGEVKSWEEKILAAPWFLHKDGTRVYRPNGC